jgi:hypothetical protein
LEGNDLSFGRKHFKVPHATGLVAAPYLPEDNDIIIGKIRHLLSWNRRSVAVIHDVSLHVEAQRGPSEMISPHNLMHTPYLRDLVRSMPHNMQNM